MEPTTTYNIIINGQVIDELSGIKERRVALLMAAQRWSREPGNVIVIVAFTSDGRTCVERRITKEGRFV